MRKKPFKWLTIGSALHITKEIAVARTLAAGGVKIALANCNPLSTQDDAAAALASEGVFCL
ncbi:MAG: adenosylhomocysteinase [Candidatus Micrarchaeia archaeon]